MPSFIDLEGKCFGRLAVISPYGIALRPDGSRRCTTWLCRCECGADVVVRGELLRNGNTSSCGCLRKEKIALLNRTHGAKVGGKVERLYRIWTGMKQRTSDQNSSFYACYGGRGIKVCDEWKADYLSFKNWALMNGYSDDLSIDRIDVNGNYCPNNCRWVSTGVQSRNTSRNRNIAFDGQTMTVRDWEIKLGFNEGTVRMRLNSGWPVERALTTPTRKSKEDA